MSLHPTLTAKLRELKKKHPHRYAQWDEAGYFAQMDSGHHAPFKTPRAGGSIYGTYRSDRGLITVSHLEEGHSLLREVLIECEDGMALTMLCEDRAAEWLGLVSAVRVA